MKSVLVVGSQKTGTTIVATVVQHSLGGGRFYVEPRSVAFFEKAGLSASPDPVVIKILYEHWMQKQSLLTGIVRGETGFRPDRTVAIVRDPRDGMISAIMYSAYERVLEGASREQVSEWVGMVRDKEADPEKYSVTHLTEGHNRIFRVEYTPASFLETFASYSAWLARNRAHFYLLRYEDFVAGNTAALSACLGREVASNRDMHPEFQRLARTKQSGNWRKMMLDEDVAFVRQRYAGALAAFGYDDWQAEPQRTDPAVGSDYIIRITEEAFRLRSQGMPSAPAAHA